MSTPVLPADHLSVVHVLPRQLPSFQEAWHDGSLAFAWGASLESCNLANPLLKAWWRRGWRYAAEVYGGAAGLDAMDEAERRELTIDPEFDWEGASC